MDLNLDLDSCLSNGFGYGFYFIWIWIWTWIYGHGFGSAFVIFSWREAHSSICRLVTGSEAPPAPNTKLSITSSFFELQVPDFARKFVWTVWTKYKSIKVQKVQKYKKYKSIHNLDIFLSSRLQICLEIHMDCPIKWQSTKVQKVQKFKKRKKKIQKMLKVQKKLSGASF